jgi:hypothetical protein
MVFHGGHGIVLVYPIVPYTFLYAHTWILMDTHGWSIAIHMPGIFISYGMIFDKALCMPCILLLWIIMVCVLLMKII